MPSFSQIQWACYKKWKVKWEAQIGIVWMFDIHLRKILWVYCPGHAGVKGNDRADRLAAKVTITGGRSCHAICDVSATLPLITSPHSLNHSLSHSLTHSPTHSLTHSITHSLTHSLNHSLTHSLTHSITHSLTHSLSLSFQPRCAASSWRPSSSSACSLPLLFSPEIIVMVSWN